VTAGASADVLFCSGFWIWYLKTKWENWIQKSSNFLFFYCSYASRESKDFFFHILR
jgi:hypothetical protein